MNTTKLFYFFFSALILNSNMYFTCSQPTATDDSAISISRGKKSKAPSKAPSVPPTKAPSVPPTKIPSKAPSKAPSVPPTKIPVTMMPSVPPTKRPTTKRPSKAPSAPPTKRPSKAPSAPPTKRPSKAPTKAPSVPQTKAPSFKPTFQPFKKVTPEIPLASSTMYPTAYLSKLPTKQPQFSIIYVSPVSSDNSNPNVPHKPKPSASPTKV